MKIVRSQVQKLVLLSLNYGVDQRQLLNIATLKISVGHFWGQITINTNF